MVLSTSNPSVDARVQKTPVKKKKATTKHVSAARNATVLAMEEALTTTTPPNSRSKTKNKFSVAEDKFLCRAFCNVSLDGRKGVGSKGAVFWDRVKEKFNALLIEHGGKGEFPNEWYEWVLWYFGICGTNIFFDWPHKDLNIKCAHQSQCLLQG